MTEPTRITPAGSNVWELDHKVHRIDGPALIYSDGTEFWCLNNIQHPFEQWKILVRQYYDTQEDYLLMLLKLD